MSVQYGVLVVDDHPIVRMGLRLLLEDAPTFTVCAEADSVAEAKRLTAELQPDFIVLDLVLGGRDGTELIGTLLTLHAGARILIYSSHDEAIYAPRCLRAGAGGYVAKSAGLARVLEALQLIARGEIAVSEAVQRALLREYADQARGDERSPLERLSDRELQVLRLLGAGHDSREIAEELHLSMKTVGTYRERLKVKLGLDTARALERYARHSTGLSPEPVPEPPPRSG